MDRRNFIRSVAAGGTVAATSWPISSGRDSLAPGCKVFTVDQAALVDAIAEQLVPKDDYPGGKEAGVTQFIDGVLAGKYGGFYRDRYEQGLRMVDEVSGKRFGANFVSLKSDQQTAVLKALESGESSPAGRDFFGLILADTMKGYYGDSSHGGNRDDISWTMIKFER